MYKYYGKITGIRVSKTLGKYTKTCDCKNHRKIYHIDNILDLN